MPKALALDANNNITEIEIISPGDSIEWSLLTGVPVYATRWPTWDEVSGKPTTFTPAEHTHTIANVTGLQAALDAKAAASHTHSAADITSGTLSDARLPSTMSGKTFTGVVAAQTLLAQRTGSNKGIELSADTTYQIAYIDFHSNNTAYLDADARIYASGSSADNTSNYGATLGYRAAGHWFIGPVSCDQSVSAKAGLFDRGGTGPDPSPALHARAGGYSIGFYPLLGSWHYNPMVQTGDSALIYTAGPNSGALVIGQWSSTARGLRIAADGVTTFSHTPTFPTASPGDNSTKGATTAFVQTALSGKANSSHTHTIADVTGLQAALDGKAAASHAHGIDQIAGLQAALDGKQPAGSYAAATHAHSASDITSGTLSDARLPSTMSGKTFTGAISAPSVAIGDQQGYLYQSNSTGSVSLRTGTAGNEKFFAFADDGRFYAHSGGANFNGDVVAAGRVTASEFASLSGNPGPKYFVGDDAALHDVNLPYTIGVAGITSPAHGYIKFGTAPGVIGWNGTTHIVETDLRVFGNVQGARMLGGDVTTGTSNPVCGGRNGQSNWNSAGVESFCTDGGWAVVTLHRSGYSHVNLIHDGYESLYIGTDGNLGGVQLRANGEIWLGDANNRLYRRRQPRIFVQAGDPGEAAVDGDLWFW